MLSSAVAPDDAYPGRSGSRLQGIKAGVIYAIPAWCAQELQYEMDSLQAHRQASDYGDSSSRDGDSVVVSLPPPALCLPQAHPDSIHTAFIPPAPPPPSQQDVCRLVVEG